MKIPHLVLPLVFIGSMVRAAETAPLAPPPKTVPQWDIFEAAYEGTAAGNPFIDVQFGATFAQGGKAVPVGGFYDGDGIYRVRFMPPTSGEWTYRTKSNRPELDGKTGRFTATAPAPGSHGPMRVHDTFHFAHADGAPYFELGTTCYVWTYQPEERQEETLRTLAASPFNKLRMCVFPKSFLYNKEEPKQVPFVLRPDGKFDPTRFDPAFWRHFERRVGDLRKLGIEADIILWHPYDRWGFSEMDDAADDRYLRYAIARLSAYANVWWSLANEYDLLNPAEKRRGTMRGNKTMDDWDRFFGILQREDPNQHLRGIHNIRGFYDHTKPWVTHASIQRNGDLRAVLGWREKYQKPIVIDECGYEGTIPQGWGKLTGPQMVQRFWVGTLSGGYVGHGETYKDPNDILWWSKGGALHGESPARLAFLRKTMEALPYTEMTPSRVGDNVLVLAKPGAAYLVYAIEPGPIKLPLPGPQTYTVEAIDTWNMKTEPLAPAKPGPFEFNAPRGDTLLRITAKKP